MHRLIARTALASALAAAVAAPLTLNAMAQTAPDLPVPSLPGVPGVPSLPGLPGLGSGLPSLPGLPGLGSLGLVPVTASPSGGSGGGSGGSNAPTANASANAVSIPPLDTCISCTNSSAGNNSAGGNSEALRILGNNVSAGSSSSPPNSSNNGNLIALPANPLLSLALFDWLTKSSASSNSSDSTARASTLDLDLNPNGTEIATLAVLEAKSHTHWTPGQSSGDSSTNGADLNLGNGALVIILLHSGSNSSTGSSAFLASINGTEIPPAGALPQNGITITIPGVITLTLLQTTASGGSATGLVAQVTNLLGMGGTQGTLLGTSGSGGSAPAAPAPPSTGTQAASSSSGISTPSTGIALGILGFLLIGGGLLALATSRVARRWGALA